MARVVVIGNAAGGKSTLARTLAGCRALPLIEVDQLLWREGWELVPAEVYEAQHEDAIGQDKWVIEGLGSQSSIPKRIARATEIVLIDLPIWLHFALAAERQLGWQHQALPPAGLATMPPTRRLFKTMWEVDRDWLPIIRDLCDLAEEEGKKVCRLKTLAEIDAFSKAQADGFP